jgi:hypothetical protein
MQFRVGGGIFGHLEEGAEDIYPSTRTSALQGFSIL